MTNGSELKSRSATALRAAGYIPLPRWWVTKEQLELIEYMAKQNVADVYRIRSETNAAQITRDKQVDAAWERRNEDQKKSNQT